MKSVCLLKKELLLSFFFTFALNLSAGRDVTNQYLKNADFSQGSPISVEIYSYGYNVENDGVYGFQNVEGWSYDVIQGDNTNPDFPNSGMGGGILAYGSTNRFGGVGDGFCAPASDKFGDTGTALGFFAVWGNGGYYYQDVTLPEGHYKITIPTFNVSGTNDYESYIGFIAKDDTKHLIQTVPKVSTWTTLTTTFTLTEATEGKIVLGYVSKNYGYTNAPHLFFDKVCIEVQEWEDCTNYIQNPGFDEDISFNVDGSAKKPLTLAFEWYDDGHSGITYRSNDGSLYNEDKGGTQGYNAAGLHNWDGYKTQIKGWELTNTSNSAKWIYYGCLPYDLGKGMMWLGHETVETVGSCTDIMIDKPETTSAPNNKGVLFLKSGWENACTYKQTIKNLPLAKYRLSYYIRNTNVDRSHLFKEATNLCNVKCNGVTFVDNEGFNSEGWVCHTIEFIPVDSFSIEFGCKTTMDFSYNNPILWIDEIQLLKIDDATDEEVDKAYEGLVQLAESLVTALHFAGDKLELQQSISNFKDDKNYIRLNQAVQKANASENKYQEIMSESSILTLIKNELGSVNTFGKSAEIIYAGYTNVLTWISSENATYKDAEKNLNSLDAYANNYSPVFIEADNLVKKYGDNKTQALCQLMEQQKETLTDINLLEVDEVNNYVVALKEAIEKVIQENKCATPIITVLSNGKIKIESKTKDAKCVTNITYSNTNPITEKEFSLNESLDTYTISSYATAEGHEDSDITTLTVEGKMTSGDVNGDGSIDISDVVVLVNFILNQ